MSFEDASAVQTSGFGSLTCISCRLLFRTPKEQREHYKSDLHRFNLKRKVADLPPVTPEVFEQKVQSNAATLASESSEQVSVAECTICNKKYSSTNALTAHLNSKKHLEMAKNPRAVPEAKPRLAAPAAQAARPTADRMAGALVPSAAAEPMETSADKDESAATDAADAEESEEAAIERRLREAVHLAPEQCLFCNHRAVDQQAALRHMTREHGLFIPDVEYLIDLPGLLAYLADKVSVGLTCLYCSQSNFQSVEAVQAHMRALSHCKLRYDDNETEYSDFYDFSSDWLKDQRHAPPAGAGVDDELDEDVINGLVAMSDNGHSLTLPDGRVVGHRSLALYYRQRYRPEETRESVRTLISEYKMLGWTSQALAVRQPGYLEKRQQQQIQRAAYMKMTLGIKANKLKRPRRNFLAANAGY